MYFLFSGEGDNDFGCGTDRMRICEGNNYKHGPMAVIVDKLVKSKYEYSILEMNACGYVSETLLAQKSKELKPLKLPRNDSERGTTYFYKNARALAKLAKEQVNTHNCQVVAILFRDKDGTQSSEGKEWKEKWTSMENGFKAEEYNDGVPMIANPKSEAWFICALKSNPYQNCNSLENRSGNDDSPNSLKRELSELNNGILPERVDLNEWIENRKIDINRIDMNSFNEFKRRLIEVI